MKSFGLWYLKNTNDKSESESEFDLHINFWSLEDYQHSNNGIVPCLDVGIKIHRYKLIDTLTFFCPFQVEKKDVIDLAEKMYTKNNASIIFNTDCEIHTKDNYTIIELESNNHLLLFPLNQVIKDVFSINNREYGTKLEFSFQNFQKYVASNSELNAQDIVYIRFRIKGIALKHQIYFDSEPLNKSFESAFSGTRMVDFKVNEKRNIDEKVRAEIIVNHEELAKLKTIHFLLMEPSAYEVKSFDNYNMNCRELEKDLWDDYLGITIDFTKSHVLAYHWKAENAENGFNCLVKVNYSKTKPLTIVVYALIVIALGIISSTFVTAVDIFWPNNWIAMILTCLFACLLIALGILIGKKIDK